jgi:glycosyltransferase involved in cell wall biosynthesis
MTQRPDPVGHRARLPGMSATDRTRLAIVVPSLTTGVRYWAPYVEMLKQQGLQVQVFTGVLPQEPAPFPLRVAKGRSIPLPAADHRVRSFFVMSPRLITELLRWRPDVIFTVEYTIASVWCLLAARISGRPTLIYQEHRNQGGLSRLRRAYRRRLAGLADGLIANTIAAHDEIEQTLRIDTSKVFDISILTPPPREVLCQRPVILESPLARPLFLYVGRLVPGKNVMTLLQAAHLLRRQGLEFSVWLLGDGPLRQSLEAARNHFGLRDTVAFLGSVPYTSTGFVYELCDVFVMPTNSDYRCVAVLEAMRFGKAVIDSKLDGNAGDTVRHGVNGLVFDPASPDELAGCMAKFIRDRRLIQEMSDKSTQIMANQALDRAMAQLTQLVRSVAVKG